ncbi:hypothetical protein C8J57DRAFT_1537489 [Mycena rebaudengoi]|nr:hypothetical protein C8J57DRAFT_1537489 [Mycena rebaudengoi]
MSPRTYTETTVQDNPMYRPSEEEKWANNRKAGMKYYYSHPDVKEWKRLRMAKNRADKKLARQVSELKGSNGENEGRFKMNTDGTPHNWGPLAELGDGEAIAAYVLTNLCGPRGRQDAAASWFPKPRGGGDPALGETELPFHALQFAYNNSVWVLGQAMMNACVGDILLALELLIRSSLSGLGVDVQHMEEMEAACVNAVGECPADLFPRAPSPFDPGQKPLMNPVMELAVKRGLAIPPGAVTPRIRTWARANSHPVPPGPQKRGIAYYATEVALLGANKRRCLRLARRALEAQTEQGTEAQSTEDDSMEEDELAGSSDQEE